MFGLPVKFCILGAGFRVYLSSFDEVEPIHIQHNIHSRKWPFTGEFEEMPPYVDSVKCLFNQMPLR
jgi:hypothetical protein